VADVLAELVDVQVPIAYVQARLGWLTPFSPKKRPARNTGQAAF
jgi:hypothetical protein